MKRNRREQITGSPMMSACSRLTCAANFANDSSDTIELAVRGEAREALVVAEVEPCVVNPFGADDTEPEVAEMVVVGGGDGQRQS